MLWHDYLTEGPTTQQLLQSLVGVFIFVCKNVTKYLNSLLICTKTIFVIAQWFTVQLAPGEVPGSNPGKGDNFLISD